MKEEYSTRTKDLEDVKKVFDSFGVRIILVYGALLGFYRDGNFLPGDDDIDLCVIDEIDYITRKKIGWKLVDLGFMPQDVGFNVFGKIEPIEPGYCGHKDTGIIVCERNFKFTIFFFKKVPCDVHREEYVCIPKYGSLQLISSPTKFYNKLDTIKINKIKYLTPSPIKDYLTFTYGNWKDKKLRNHGELFDAMHGKELTIEDYLNVAKNL